MPDTQNQLKSLKKETLMKNTAITTFAAIIALSAGLAAAKGSHQPQWHAQDHGEIAGLQTAQHDNIKRAAKNDDRTQLVMPAAAQAQADEAYRPLRRTESR